MYACLMDRALWIRRARVVAGKPIVLAANGGSTNAVKDYEYHNASFL